MIILLTAIGSFSADCVVSSLKRKGHRVIGCDIYPAEWHPVSKDCDKVYQVPFATKELDYVHALLDICSVENVDLLFPLTDLEIDVLNNYREDFETVGVNLCIQSKYCLSIARNKYEMAQMFAEDEFVKIPKTRLAAAEALEAIIFPVIAKPYNGRSSEGLMKLMSKDDMCLINNREKYIFQELLSGNVYTVDYVRDIYGNDFSVPREELLRTKNGAGTTVRVVPDERIQKMVSYIGTKLEIVGCVNMEFIHHEDDFYLIDINPRFSAGVAFSCCVGYDMVISHLNACMAKSIEKPVPFDEQIIAKRYKEEVLWIKKKRLN